MATVETRPKRVLITGASGRMGRVLTPLARLAGWDVFAPPRSELDIANPSLCRLAVMNFAPDLVIHLAALANTAECESNYKLATLLNVTATANLLAARSLASRRTCKFVFLSTDYVFDGRKSIAISHVPKDGAYYQESDKALPVNFYGLTKLLAEQLVLSEIDTTVLRAPFRKDPPWPYPRAFSDQWTSCDFASVVAPKVWAFCEYFAEVETRWPLGEPAILHIGGPRRSIFELAQLASPSMQYSATRPTGVYPNESPAPCLRAEFKGPIWGSRSIELPRDVSLDSSKWQSLTEQFTP